MKYWYNPEDDTFIDKSGEVVVGLSDAAKREAKRTKNILSDSWPRVKDTLKRTGSVTKKGATYLKESPKRWQNDIDQRVQHNMEKWEQAQQPMTPEEYQKMLEEYQPPQPEYPPPQPTREEQLYQNRKPRPPPTPAYPPPVLTEEQYYTLEPGQNEYYRVGKNQKKSVKRKTKKRRK